MSNNSDLIEIMALGHQFTIGNPYNYVEGVVVKDMWLWDSDDVSKLANKDPETKTTAKVYKITFKNQAVDEDDPDEFSLPSIGMDNLSALSFIAGLICPSPRSVWQFVADRLSGKNVPNSDEVAIHYRYVTEKILLDPVNQLEIFCRLDRLKQSKATHVVVGITYGWEAFCQFSYKNPPVNSSYESMEKLLDHSQNFADNLLNDNKRLSKQDESNQLDLKCIVYSDTKSGKTERNDLSSLSVNKQYEACKQILNVSTNKAIPLKVQLYPLDKLASTRGSVCRMPTNLKMRKNLILHYYKMWKSWQQFYENNNSITTDPERFDGPSILSNSYKRIKETNEFVQQFQSNFIAALANLISAFRQGSIDEEEISDYLKRIENESPFNSKELTNWLGRQVQQINALKKLIAFPGVRFVYEREEMRERVRNDNQYTFCLVLHLPSLEEQSDEFFNEMKLYVSEFDPIHPSKRILKKKTNKKIYNPNYRQIISAAQQFSNWVKDHNKNTEHVDYIIFFNNQMDIEKNSPVITFYQKGEARVINDNFLIPEAPGEVTVLKNRRGVITLKWESEDSKSFLLEYRRAECTENEPWKSIEYPTNSITIDYLQSDQTYVFRVAVLTLAGRSPFSPISEEITIDSVCPPPNLPQCQVVTDTSIDITWDHHHDIQKNVNKIEISSYSIECWVDESRQDSTLIQRSTKSKNILLEPLELDTQYCIQIRAICIDSTGSTVYSPNSPILRVKTLQKPERPAVTVRRVSKRCKSGILGVNTFQLPLKKHRDVGNSGVGRYVFGEPSYLALFGNRRQRTILMLGATGSGKSTLINAMVNYILDVKWSDDFRFKLIDESTDKSQAYSQTDLVTTYDLYQMKGSRLDYSLTVVDTPGFGDTSGLEKDKKIMEQIRDYFKSNHGIQQLEAVCFVVQSSLPRLTPTQQYIFDSVLSIFSQEIKDNIRLMVTFADISVPPVLAAVKEAKIPSPVDPKTGIPLHHKFNNSIFFISNQESSEVNEINETYFDVAVEGFDRFFDDLSRMESKSLTLTREVLEERKKLEALVEGLQIRTQMKLIRVDELENIKKKLTENIDQMEANQNFEFEVDYLVPKVTDISGTGQFTTNCQNCKMTCHFPCRQAHDVDKHLCSVMNSDGSCMICKCTWSNHFNQKYRYEMVKEKVKRSSDAIRQQYQKAQKEKLTNKELLTKIENEIKDQEKQLMELMEATHPHIRRLDEIALKPHPTSTLAYIDLMIETEKQKHSPGYQQRIVTLEKLRKMAELTAKLIEDQGKSKKTQLSTPQSQREKKSFFQVTATPVVPSSSTPSLQQLGSGKNQRFRKN